MEAREIDKIGTDGIIKKILDRVGTEKPVYLSLDIDTLDPACELPNWPLALLFFFFIIMQGLIAIETVVAPATGTPETGGWSTRELRTILRGLEDLNLVAADIVEVAVSA